MINLILIAPPAAGKGTQASLISKEYDIPHISIGEILRKEISNNSDVGKIVKNMIASGQLAPDDLVSKLLEKRLLEDDCEKGFILDGFPRNIHQANILEEILKSQNKQITKVFLLSIDKEIAKKRLLGRLICSNCSANYNDLFEDSKPNKNGKCDLCSGTLVRREDDNEETFETRFLSYEKDTLPIIEHYNTRNILIEIDAGISVEHTFSLIKKVLNDKN